MSKLVASVRWIFVAELLILARASCLPDAVRHRKNLTNAAGESYPVGFAVATWSSARLSSAMLEILAEEMLGYNTRVDPSAVSSSREGMYALLGCATWKDAEDRGCSNREVRIHVMADSWWTSFPEVLNAINEQYKAEAPVFGGDMGYVGDAGTYVPQGVLDAGEAEGLALEYYKSYDTRWHQPWRYFDNLTRLNASAEAMPCVDSVMAENSTIYTYLQITGDRAGIVVDGNAYRGNCEDGYTWRSPACRSNPERCVMYITGGDGWDLPKGMQRSAVFNMPMAIVVAKSWNEYLELPTKYKALMFWWTPDDSFLDIGPQPVIFPPRDPVAQSRGDVTSSYVKTEIAKVVSSDLESMAPDLVQMFESSLT